MSRYFDRLRTGLWFVPGLIIGVAGILVVVVTRLDSVITDLPAITDDASTARTVLSTLATATVTFASLVFSITIVALQLTSSQYSPRVLRQFLRDRPSQIALGIFAGNFLYDLAILSLIDAGEDFVGGLSLTVALLLGGLVLATFIGFVHHITQAIRVENIIEQVATETRTTATTLRRQAPDDPDADEVLQSLAIGAVLARPGPGAVLQSVSVDRLVSLACAHDVVIRLTREAGDFVASGVVVAEIWSPPGTKVNLTYDDVDRCLGFGTGRTMTVDIAFGYRQLADIAERALSPGVNDPTTAVQAIDRLHDLLRVEATAANVASVHCDEEGNLRVLTIAVSFSGLTHLAFDEIRQYGSGSFQVVRRLRSALEDLRTVAPPERHDALDAQLESLSAAVHRSFEDRHDRSRAGVADEQGVGGEESVSDRSDAPE